MKIENFGSPIDMHILASRAFDNRITLTFDLLTSGSMHAQRLLCTVCLPSLVLIARAVCLLQRGHRDRQTDTHSHRQH